MPLRVLGQIPPVILAQPVGLAIQQDLHEAVGFGLLDPAQIQPGVAIQPLELAQRLAQRVTLRRS
jgi:hypothetical protein